MAPATALVVPGSRETTWTLLLADKVVDLIYTRSRLERPFRDVHTPRRHGFTAESRYETAGQVYLGVAPEFGLVAF